MAKFFTHQSQNLQFAICCNPSLNGVRGAFGNVSSTNQEIKYLPMDNATPQGLHVTFKRIDIFQRQQVAGYRIAKEQWKETKVVGQEVDWK